jgi:hypothetical protein
VCGVNGVKHTGWGNDNSPPVLLVYCHFFLLLGCCHFYLQAKIRIAQTYAALNGLEVWAADIRNAYLQAPSSNKDYIVCGPEFGIEHEGKVALIHRALYEGKSAGRDFKITCGHACIFSISNRFQPTRMCGCARQLKVTTRKYGTVF